MSLATKLKWLFRHPTFKREPLSVLRGVGRWEIHRAFNRNIKLSYDGLQLISRPYDGNGRLIAYFGADFDHIHSFMKAYLKPGMFYVDVGANIGSHVVNAARQVGTTGTVIAFEAEPETYALLQQNIAMNELSNVDARQECVSDRPGTLTLNINRDSAKNSLVHTGERSVDVSADTLDHMLADRPRCDLIKIDVEGADLSVLKGASAIFEKAPPAVVLIEIFDVRSNRASKEEILEFLTSRGYEIFEYRNGKLIDTDPARRPMNAYAVHRSAIASIQPLLA